MKPSPPAPKQVPGSTATPAPNTWPATTARAPRPRPPRPGPAPGTLGHRAAAPQGSDQAQGIPAGRATGAASNCNRRSAAGVGGRSAGHKAQVPTRGRPNPAGRGRTRSRP